MLPCGALLDREFRPPHGYDCTPQTMSQHTTHVDLDRLRTDREYLHHLYWHRGFRQEELARRAGVSQKQIRRLLHKHDIAVAHPSRINCEGYKLRADDFDEYVSDRTLDAAKKLFDRIDPEINGSPTSVVLGTIYVVALIRGEDVSAEDLADAGDISVETLRGAYREVVDSTDAIPNPPGTCGTTINQQRWFFELNVDFNDVMAPGPTPRASELP